MVVTITSAYGGSYGTKKPKPYWWCGRDRDNRLVHDLIARGHLLFKDQFLLKLYAKWWQIIWRQIKIKVASMLDASQNQVPWISEVCLTSSAICKQFRQWNVTRKRRNTATRRCYVHGALSYILLMCTQSIPGPSINPRRGSICDREGPGRPVRVAKTPARLPRVKRTYKEQPG